MGKKSEQELLTEAQMQLEIVARKIDEMLPRTHRKRRKKVKTDGPIMSCDLGLECEEALDDGSK